MQSLQRAAVALAEHFNRQPLSVGALLNFHFELQRFVKLVEALRDHSLFDVQSLLGTRSGLDADAETEQEVSDAALCVRNVAPACRMRPFGPRVANGSRRSMMMHRHPKS